MTMSEKALAAIKKITYHEEQGFDFEESSQFIEDHGEAVCKALERLILIEKAVEKDATYRKANIA